MPQYCTDSSSATVKYSFNQQSQPDLIFNKTPITVEISEVGGNSGSGSTCWRFTGTINADRRSAELFASGISPSFVFNGGQGMEPRMDGQVIIGGYAFYVGSQSVSAASSSSPTPGLDSQGSCNNKQCKLTVNYEGLKLFEKVGECPIKYTVSCGDGCPEGFCKCIIPEYPGYCCLDCNSTAASIRSITNELRGKNGK